MRVLLTGTNGFIGRHVAHELNANKIDFVGVSRKSELRYGKNGIVLDLLRTKNVSDSIKHIKATHLIHLAWYTEHGKYWQSPLNLEWMLATYRLVEAFCLHGGQHILITGTCAEYDWRYGVCSEESTPINPSTLYGLAKNTTHSFSKTLCVKHNVPLAWARIFFPYGAGEAKARLIPSLFSAFSGEIPLFGVNGDSYRDFLHIHDLAKALVMCAVNSVDGTLNVSSGVPIPIRDIVAIIAHKFSRSPVEVLNIESERKNEPKLLIGDNASITRLGWKQKIDIVEGLLNY
jgi:nucleoside-diphosphate-sugar epimerase